VWRISLDHSRQQPVTPLEDELRRHEIVWRSKPLLRRLYREWHELVAARLAAVPGATVELGAGIGSFKEVVPTAVATDIEPTPWADAVVNAERLPYSDGSLANLVLVDVFHHLARPARFLDEAVRVLAPGGRVVLLEPYCSPVSTFAYRHFHHEEIDLTRPPFGDDASLDTSPLSANEARPTLAFFRNTNELGERWPQLELVERRRLALFLYALSGGFSRRQLVPVRAYRPLAALERLLSPLAPLLAFRCLVVLEQAGQAQVKPGRA
jgi:SAM-dependent methyltransferase